MKLRCYVGIWYTTGRARLVPRCHGSHGIIDATKKGWRPIPEAWAVRHSTDIIWVL